MTQARGDQEIRRNEVNATTGGKEFRREMTQDNRRSGGMTQNDREQGSRREIISAGRLTGPGVRSQQTLYDQPELLTTCEREAGNTV